MHVRKRQQVRFFRNEAFLRYVTLRNIILLLIVTLLFIKFKPVFFIMLFVMLNLLGIYLNSIGIFNPLKFSEFGTFMCSYAYGPAAGCVVAASGLISSLFLGKAGFYKMAINFLLFGMAFLIPLLRFLPVATAGIVFISARALLDVVMNLIVFRDLGSMNKNMKRLLDTGFWIFIYSMFGEGILLLMA